MVDAKEASSKHHLGLYNNAAHMRKLTLPILQGSLNAKRQAMVDKAYLKFDKNGDGEITAADLKGVYNCSMHPKVQNGEMTEDEVFLEFL